MDNVIFLDIDGVLNSSSYLEILKDKKIDINWIDPKNVKVLKNIVEKTMFKTIILSSSWRFHFEIKNEVLILKQTSEKCEDKILLIEEMKKNKLFLKGKTEYLHMNRYDEIKKFIDDNAIKNFIVIDDEDFDGTLLQFGKRFIQTNFHENGLTKKQLEKILKREKNNFK